MTLHLAVAQIRPKKADYADNLRRVGGVLATVSQWKTPPDLIVFPESVMSGYDLQGGTREAAVTAGGLVDDLAKLHADVGAPSLDIVVGFYEEFQNRVYNSAVYATLSHGDGLIRHVHRKVFLPTYGPFDEARYSNHGHSVQAFDTDWGRAAIIICEDVWHSITATLAALDGAQLLIVPSAPPARGLAPQNECAESESHRPASVCRWERIVQHLAEEHGIFVVLANLVGFDGGKALQGGSTVVGPRGEKLAAAPAFEEALIAVDLELDAITRVRSNSTMLADLETQLLNLLRPMDEEADAVEYDGSPREQMTSVEAKPVTLRVVEQAEPEHPLAIDAALAEHWLTAFLKAEVVEKRGFSKGIVGLSGGVDSALAVTLVARALGPENVIGVRLPYKKSSADSLEHAALVADLLGIKLETVEITAAVDGFRKAAGDDTTPTRLGNVAARMRMITLFDLSAKYEALPIGTGNKTERLLGYFTWHGDDSPPINPLGDLFKTQVLELARHMGVPNEIISKPATADLVEGQTDEADLGITYAKTDLILHWLLSGWNPPQIVQRGFDSADVELVNERLNATHWKRSLPTVAMVSDTAIGASYLRPVDR